MCANVVIEKSAVEYVCQEISILKVENLKDRARAARLGRGLEFSEATTPPPSTGSVMG